MERARRIIRTPKRKMKNRKSSSDCFEKREREKSCSSSSSLCMRVISSSRLDIVLFSPCACNLLFFFSAGAFIHKNHLVHLSHFLKRGAFLQFFSLFFWFCSLLSKNFLLHKHKKTHAQQHTHAFFGAAHINKRRDGKPDVKIYIYREKGAFFVFRLSFARVIYI